MSINHKHQEDGHTRFSTARLEAFSDAVMAIIITITVLQLQIPKTAVWQELVALLPWLITYLVSFQTIGTYWNNHHHLLKSTQHVSPSIMWANLHLLFWLSLIPFATGWLGTHPWATAPSAAYAALLFVCALAYFLLQSAVVWHSEQRESLMKELNQSKKGLASLVIYLVAYVFAFIAPIVTYGLIILVSILWFIPDRRIERGIAAH